MGVETHDPIILHVITKDFIDRGNRVPGLAAIVTVEARLVPNKLSKLLIDYRPDTRRIDLIREDSQQILASVAYVNNVTLGINGEMPTHGQLFIIGIPSVVG